MAITNTTLAMLVGAVLVISAIGLGMTAINMMGGVSATGAVAGTTTVSVASMVQISLTTSSVDFGTMNQNDTNNTSDDIPYPFVVQNDGSVNVNITINSTDLWGGTGAQNPSSYYRFAANTSTEGTCFNTGQSITTYTNMPNSVTPTKAIAILTHQNSCDTAQLEIDVTVPVDESAGAKSSTVTFTATQS